MSSHLLSSHLLTSSAAYELTATLRNTWPDARLEFEGKDYPNGLNFSVLPIPTSSVVCVDAACAPRSLHQVRGDERSGDCGGGRHRLSDYRVCIHAASLILKDPLRIRTENTRVV
jgi:hypothetical protein